MQQFVGLAGGTQIGKDSPATRVTNRNELPIVGFLLQAAKVHLPEPAAIEPFR